MYCIYGDSKSGNCYKVKLLCDLLAIEYRWQHVGILAKESQTAEFLALNPNGKIPLLAIDEQTFLAESNAILVYLAEDSVYWPAERLTRARVLQWLFFEQYSHEPYLVFVLKRLPWRFAKPR